MKIESLKDLLVHELKDLYSAESQIAKALPKMEEAASNEELKQAFRNHLNETEGQIERLLTIFEEFDYAARGQKCEAAAGLIEEGEEIIKELAAGDLRDAALVGAAQRVEHYEMAGYGTARTFAEVLGLSKVQSLLQETLDEEGKTNKLLTKISKKLNRQAAGV